MWQDWSINQFSCQINPMIETTSVNSKEHKIIISLCSRNKVDTWVCMHAKIEILSSPYLWETCFWGCALTSNFCIEHSNYIYQKQEVSLKCQIKKCVRNQVGEGLISSHHCTSNMFNLTIMMTSLGPSDIQ